MFPLSILLPCLNIPTPQRSSTTMWPPSLSRRSYNYATSQAFISVFRIRPLWISLNCMSLVHAAWFYVHDLPQGDISRTQVTPPCLRTWYDRPGIDLLSPATLQSLYAQLQSQLQSTPPSSKRRSWATNAKRCKRQAYLPDYVAQVSSPP